MYAMIVFCLLQCSPESAPTSVFLFKTEQGCNDFTAEILATRDRYGGDFKYSVKCVPAIATK